MEEVTPYLPPGISPNGKGIGPRLQMLVYLFYVTSGIPLRHLAVASGKFIIHKLCGEQIYGKNLRFGLVLDPFAVLIQYGGEAKEVLVEYCTSWEDISVNTVIILRN